MKNNYSINCLYPGRETQNAVMENSTLQAVQTYISVLKSQGYICFTLFDESGIEYKVSRLGVIENLQAKQ